MFEAYPLAVWAKWVFFVRQCSGICGEEDVESLGASRFSWRCISKPMAMESFIKTLYAPEDALRLRQGKLRNQKAFEHSLLDNKAVLDAAEILILLDDANNLCSRADVIERAISYGWKPVEIHSSSILTVAQTSNRSGRLFRYFWRNILTGTVKFLLRIIPKKD